jgi:hypothetical protein
MKHLTVLLAVLCLLSGTMNAQWVKTSLDSGGVRDLAVIGSRIFVYQNHEVLVSNDNGDSWTPVRNGLPSSPQIEAFAVSGSKLFAADVCRGVFLSTNNGDSWDGMNATWPDGLPYGCPFGMPEIHSLGILDSTIVAGTYMNGIFSSNDNGMSWWGDGSPNVTQVLSFAASGSNIYTGTDDGVYRSSDNGLSWARVDTGSTLGGDINALVFSGSNLFAGISYWQCTIFCPNGVYLSTDNGISWTRQTTGWPFYGGSQYGRADALCVSGQNLFAAGDGVFLSTNNGANWTQVSIGLPTNPYDTLYQPVWSLAISGDNLFAVTHQSGVWKRPLSEMVPTSSFRVREKWNLVSLPVAATDNRREILFPTAVSDAFAYDTAYVPCDTLRNGIGYWLKFPADTVCEMVDSNYVLAETVSVAPGWNLVGSISMAIPVTDITSDSASLTTSNFFGYDGGYYVADKVLPGQGYWVKVNQAGNLILSVGGKATPSNRIKIVPTEELPPDPPGGSVVEIIPTIPSKFELMQNYPNPFNPVTSISYGLPIAEYVTLTVFNVIGQRVIELVNGMQEPGYKTVSFDASNLPSGVYTYRITAGTFTDVKKMLQIK